MSGMSKDGGRLGAAIGFVGGLGEESEADAAVSASLSGCACFLRLLGTGARLDAAEADLLGMKCRDLWSLVDKHD
jgi:hypothetical protein